MWSRLAWRHGFVFFNSETNYEIWFVAPVAAEVQNRFHLRNVLTNRSIVSPAVKGSIHPTNRSVTLDFQAAVIRHQKTADDEGFRTLDDLIARVDDHGLSGTVPLAFCGNDGVNGNSDAFRANIFSQNVALEETR
ncbi:hypothetical protein CTI12_AA166100 [Artemisia annua]|uniref:Uncharacterized protein n=1 Tax=Artemisia annua TaxID=35608 RepID=A0A2U1PCU9_ARTAN|nr:hypothetical protein CTI12_AA166100 [Artemisia annua]